MKHILILLYLLTFFTTSEGQLSVINYRIYSVKQDKEVTLQDIANDLKNYDVLIFGEEHNDSVTHYLQLKMFELLHTEFGKNIALSMEMFDRDVQVVMNEYLKGYIREKNFTKDARVWSNYRDYRPMIEFAKEKDLDVICANAPGRYVNLAGRKGQEALLELSVEAKRSIPPLPYDTATGGYYNKLMALTQHTPLPSKDSTKATMPVMAMGSFNLIMSQSLWDATMAYSIAQYIKNNKKQKVMQLNGKFHSDEGFGIVTQLKKYSPKMRTLIISTASDDSFPSINWNEYKQYGDYIIITDPSVPRTYKD